MTLTDTQKEWANAQVGADLDAVLDGTITKKSGRKGDYTMEVEGPNGKAVFSLATDDSSLADNHIGVISSVKVEGKVTKVTLDEENGRVGLVIKGKNGTVTQWHIPERSDAEIEAARRPDPTPQEQAATEKANKNANDARLKGSLIRLLADPEVVAALKKAVI